MQKFGLPISVQSFLDHFHDIRPPSHLFFPSHRHANGSLSISNADRSANEWEIKRNEYYRCRYTQTNVGPSTTVRLIKLIEYKLPALVNEAKKREKIYFNRFYNSEPSCVCANLFRFYFAHSIITLVGAFLFLFIQLHFLMKMKNQQRVYPQWSTVLSKRGNDVK